MGTVVVGVEPGQSPSVLVAVASLAADLGAKVQVIFADSGRYVTAKVAGTDPLESADAQFPEELAAQVAAVLGELDYELHQIPGDPLKVLSAVAESVDAQMIVIGTRRPGLRNKMAEFIDGSIAVGLAHKQQRPVLVVPQTPQSANALPWE